MGLIYPQAVKIRPIGQNIQYYSNLGYNIPMKPAAPSVTNRDGRVMVPDRFTLFDVVADDLPDSSNVILWYNCDCCGELNYIQKSMYTRRHTNPYRPIYCRKCSITTMNTGSLSGTWNPNLSQEDREDERKYPEYYDFIKRVLARDNYTCQCCGKESEGDVIVHHLNGYNWDKEHRTDDTNGITLCKKCHKNFHSLYGIGDNTKEQFEEWIGRRIELIKYTGEIYSLPKVYCIEDDIIYEDRFDAANKLNCDSTSIWNMCVGKQATYHGKHYVYYENYLNMTNEEIEVLLSKGFKKYREDKRVICKNTGLVFEKPSVAASYYNYNHTENINNCCNGIQRSAGQYNGYFLQWMWFTDFQSLSPHEQLQIALDNKETLQEGSFLYELLYCNDKKDLLSPTLSLNSITA